MVTVSTQLLCPLPLWDGVDFTSCTESLYFNVYFPWLCILVSLVILLRCSPLSISDLRSSRVVSLGLDDELLAVPSVRPALYRLRTTNNGGHDATATVVVSEDDIFANIPLISDDPAKIDVIPITVRGTRIRLALERALLLLLSAVHLTTIAVIIFKHNEPQSNRLGQSVTSALLWCYCLGLSSLRNMRSSPDLARIASGQLALIYLTSWSISAFKVRSLWITSTSIFVDALRFIDFLVIFALVVIALSSPLGICPPYLEVRKGLLRDPQTGASLYSYLTLSWLESLLRTGFHKPLTLDDVPDIPDDYRCSAIMKRQRNVKQSGLVRLLIQIFAPDLSLALVWTTLVAVMSFAPTLLVKAILEYIESPGNKPIHVAWLYVCLLFVATALNSIFTLHQLFEFFKLQLKIKGFLICKIYAKALRRKAIVLTSTFSSEKKGKDDAPAGNENKTEEDVNIGTIINIMSTDAIEIQEAVGRLHRLFKGLLMIFLALAFLYRNLGVSAFAGILSMIVLLPINYKISSRFSAIIFSFLKIRDERVAKTSEIMQSIKIIKLFTWEPMFHDRIMEVRKRELNRLKERFILNTWAGAVMSGSPLIVTLITFAVYSGIAKHELTASVAFTSVALFNLMRAPMDSLSGILSDLWSTRIAIGRIERFLSEESTGKYDQLSQARGPNSPLIGFENATVTWGNDANSKKFRLQNLNVSFEEGALTVVIGPTGSGKTSLLMALLGEMTLLTGHVFLPGVATAHAHTIDPESGFSESVAYCSQQAWLLNESIRDNILFGLPYNKSHYQACVRACALVRDLEILDSGDQTIVGERGISLSGGQKQRISLARALYSPARHVLLDDCLSAVDSHTARFIYEKCITGPLMKNRTCILVSHNVPLTVIGAHHIVVMRDGNIQFQGTPEDAYSLGLLGDDELLKQSISSRESSRQMSRVSSAVNVDVASGRSQAGSEELEVIIDELENDDLEAIFKTEAAPVSQIESQEVGDVKFSLFARYISATGTPQFLVALIVTIAAYECSVLFQSWWIREWSAAAVASSDRAASAQAHGTGFYLGMYALICLNCLLIVVLRNGLVYLGSLHASVTIFDQFLEKVIRAKPRFFDSTPVGRIMNRFSRDFVLIDRDVAFDMMKCVAEFLGLLAIVLMITSVIPGFILPAIVIFAVFYGINEFYMRSSRELKRLGSVTRTPAYQHFGETLVGLSTIRAYAYEKKFMLQNMLYVDTNTRTFFTSWAATRWMSARIDVAGGFISFLTGAFLLWNIDSIDSGLAGLCLTYAITFSEKVYGFIFLYAWNQLIMNSVERIDEYIKIEQEDADIIPDHRPPYDWPSKGEIQVKNLSLRYAPEFPRVIDGVTFSVQPGWKVGIVGRTGAGKSTIASAFFRFLDFDEGSITIDGIDISTIGLRDLRQSLTIIPQDPTLFSGTIRSNLDPFNHYSDSKIFEALRRVHLIDRDEDLGTTSSHIQERNVNIFYDLDSPLSEGGTNLSQGQRQLLCLARSLLTNPKVIVLDEATASIDYHTDSLIQDTIRREFSETTILTIAHRLRSVIDYDMILVLDAGKVKEYNKPHILLQDKDSIFRSMCESSGELEALEELAEQVYMKQTRLE